MKTTQLKALIAKTSTLQVDVLSKRGDVFTAKRSYYWGMTKSGETFADRIKTEIEKIDNSIKIQIVDSGNHWHTFVGNAKTGSAQDSYWWAKFKVVPNLDKVKVINILSGIECEIPACDVGTCNDPSTERYHCM